MGRKDTITKQFLSQPDIFADAFNYCIFDGKQVIKAEELDEQDSTETAVMERLGKVFTKQKMRDILKLCTIRRSKYATLVLLGIEAQANVSFIMPVRDYLYDALNYEEQVEAIRKGHEKAGDLKTPAELMSGFAKKDKLIPVITLCVCFDKAKWDGPKALSDMFAKVDPRIKPFINDYHLNLITPSEIPDFSKFSSQLGVVMEFIQNSNDKKKLCAIIEAKDEYKSMDVGTVDIINIYTDAKLSKKTAEGGKVNMCSAIQGLMEDSRLAGQTEGENRIVKLLKLLEPGTKEFDKALNGSAAERKKLYKKYKIID